MRRSAARWDGLLNRKKSLGNDLLSQEVALQVPSALISLTTGFEMLPGVPLSLQSPRDFIYKANLNSDDIGLENIDV